MNNKGAVNTYRFITIFILIGIIMAGISTMNTDIQNESYKSYNLSGKYKLNELADRSQQNIQQGDDIVKTNQQVLTGGWGNENAMGKNIAQILMNFAFPMNEISTLRNDGRITELEQAGLWILILLRSIITIFAGYELFQIVIKNKNT